MISKRKAHTIYFIFIIFMITSCSKRECKLEKISTDYKSKVLKKKYFITNGKEFDSLVLIDSFDNVDKESIKTLMNNKECNHTLRASYKFKNMKIGYQLKKLINDDYIVSLFNESCIYKDKIFDAKSLMNDSLVIYKPQNCFELLEIKEIGVKNLSITYFITEKDEKWIVTHDGASMSESGYR